MGGRSSWVEINSIWGLRGIWLCGPFVISENFAIFANIIIKSMRIFVTFLAAVLSCAVLSAQSGSITPAPVRVQGGVCIDGQCGMPTPFDATQMFKLCIKGADAVDAARLEAAVSAAGLQYERVKRPAKSRFINVDIFPESMDYEEGYVIWTAPEGVCITAKTAAGAY